MRILIFGGTSEGRLRAQAETEAGNSVLVSVATPTGQAELPEGIDCAVGRLEAEDMVNLARSFGAERLIDATHPFAQAASANIAQAAKLLGLPLETVRRASDEGADFASQVTWAASHREAIERLKRMEGRVLLTTGSSALREYARALSRERLFVRVLPVPEALAECAAAGIPAAHICAMQGPFTEEMNQALYRQWQISAMVTKDSGSAGGVREKVLPALRAGIDVLVIRRPSKGDGV